MSADRLEGLRAAVELSPDNHALRLVLAEALREAGRDQEALTAYSGLLDRDALPREELVGVGELALARDRLQLAARCLEAARAQGVQGGTAGLAERLEDALADSGVMQPAIDEEDEDEEEWGGVADLVEAAEQVTFADVGGLQEVKDAVHRTIILPFQRPDLYAKYGRRAGGGVLLYGPPGCGKTLLARATAGECGLPFLNLRLEEVLDPMYGVSERRLHSAFAQAREQAPCVLFLDELDALAFGRRKQSGSAGRALVDQLLQELDAIGAENDGLLVLAATNAPWDVDDALKRPGRFDRVVFVPPPDEEARRHVLELGLRDRPVGRLDLRTLAARTPLLSGADLSAVVERATDAAIDVALSTGRDEPIGQHQLEAAVAAVRATTLEWLRTARNHVEFANDSGSYDEVAAFLASSEVKRALNRSKGV